MENLDPRSTDRRTSRISVFPPPRRVTRPCCNDAPAATPSSVGGLVLAILFALAVIFGIRDRSQHESTLKTATDAAAIPTVNTTYPSGGATSQEVILPGNIQAFIEPPSTPAPTAI